jgi:tripartite-type tricarboxylate transporter receptor subunit TctC
MAWNQVLTAIGLTALVATPAARAAEQPLPYPVRVVTLVTHSSPGGGSDVFLRELTRYLVKYIDATFIVENAEGGSGAKAMSRVASARADGSVLYASTPTYIMTSLLSQPGHTYRDLEPVVNFFLDTEVVYTRADGPYRTLEDVLDHARRGRGRWGAANPSSLERQAAERLRAAAGVDAGIVPHNGGGDLMINILNGTLEMGVGEMDELRSQLAGGTVRVLATFGSERIPTHPDVPTVKEAGYDVELEKFRGLAGPKGLPPEVIRIWNEAAQKVLADAEYRERYLAGNLKPRFMPHEQFVPFIAQVAEETAALYAAAGVTR